MTLDPLSDALNVLNARSAISGALKAGGTWALQLPEPQGVKFNAVVKGGYWLIPDPREDLETIWVETGDVVLFNGCYGYVMASDTKPALTPQNGREAYRQTTDNCLVLGDGLECHMLGLHVRLDADGIDFLTGTLPKLVRIRANHREAGILRWLMEQMIAENTLSLPGQNVAANQLAQLMFVQVLRAYIATADPQERGWLQAIGDPHIGPALRHIHTQPAHNWTLAELSQKVAMSRTSFALHFRTKVGMPPLTYVQNWRMRLARRALRDRDIPVSSLAMELGYQSESAFSNAFKRHSGRSPKQFRHHIRQQPETNPGGANGTDSTAMATAPTGATPPSAPVTPATEPENI
ncbi:AraC family transcriptional regulator [Thalassospira marina]|uniref:AraC family transcriptional regulator n=1 Tax=Thalassospira marina TaxID=2048283 RepID=A0A2N3KZ26_9PROT|nr:AraC family transcriptional regulator [Thalassospira marina]PKR55737.1 AraC family transcriptional regulator [Thalassospira marina]